MVAFNSSNLLGQQVISLPLVHLFWRRNPFYINNFIPMQETQNKEQFTFVVLS